MSEKSILKPCPFCGGNNAEHVWGGEFGDEYWVCDQCGASSGNVDSKWNWQSRPLEDALRARAEEDERLKAALHKQIETLEKYGAGICRGCYDLIDDEDKSIRENQLRAERDAAMKAQREAEGMVERLIEASKVVIANAYENEGWVLLNSIVKIQTLIDEWRNRKETK